MTRAKDGAPFRVLNIIDTLGRGGAETLLVHLAEDLRSRGAAFEVAVLSEPHTLASELERRGVEVHRRPASGLSVSRVPEAAVWVASLVKRTSPTIVHAHLLHATLTLGARGAWRRPARTVVSLHNLDYESWRLSPWKRRVLKRMHGTVLRHGADRVVAVSDAVARHYRDQLGVSVSEVLPNAVPTEALTATRASTALLVALGLAARRPTLVAVGRLVRQKGHERTIRALARLKALGTDAQLLIVGDGPERDGLSALVHELGLEGRVVLAPARPHPELMTLIASCEVFVMPSRFEGFGIALIEAMMLSVPPVVSDISPLRELVGHGRFGHVVDAEDIDQLAATLAELLADGEGRRALGTRAREYATRQFSTQTVAQRWMELYRELHEA